MIKKANIPLTAKQLAKMSEKGSITFDNAIQRGYVWDQKRKSLLIHSMIEGYPIPAFYAAKDDNGNYSMLDGKQRSDAIKGFLNNEYELHEDTPEITLDSGYIDNISGMIFDNLSEDIQDRIKDYSLTIYYFEGITDEEINEMFFRLNNGKPLSAIELTRVKAKSIETIRRLGKHPIFSEAISEKALSKYTNEDIVIKSWAILNTNNPSFETKEIRPMIESAEITVDQAAQIDNAFTRIMDTHLYITKKLEFTEDKTELKAIAKTAKHIFTRTHLISLVPFAIQSINENVSLPAFAEWAKSFYSGKKSASINDKYNEAAGSGSAKAESIRNRLEALQADYNSYFKSSNEEEKREVA
jgi:hypothetical protein